MKKQQVISHRWECAWEGCEDTCEFGQLPDDWRWLFVYWAADSQEQGISSLT
jgi:hypothetical protein